MDPGLVSADLLFLSNGLLETVGKIDPVICPVDARGVSTIAGASHFPASPAAAVQSEEVVLESPLP